MKREHRLLTEEDMEFVKKIVNFLLRFISLDSESRHERNKKNAETHFRNACISQAEWRYSEIFHAIKSNDEDYIKDMLWKCISYILLAHINGPHSSVSGYTLDTDIINLITRAEKNKDNLTAKLREIVMEADAKRRFLLTEELVRLGMGVFDPSGCPMERKIFYKVLQITKPANIGIFHTEKSVVSA